MLNDASLPARVYRSTASIEWTDRGFCSIYVLMRNAVRNHLRLIISIALAMVKRQQRRDYSEKITSRSDPATQAIALQVAEAVLRHFDVQRKPDRAIGPPLGSEGTDTLPDGPPADRDCPRPQSGERSR